MATPVNGIYVLQGVDPAQIAAAPVGVKAVEIYDDNGNLFTPAQVQQMESGGSSVLGYFSIGEAENYRPYFASLPSSVLGPQDPSWPGDYQVAYWTPQWLNVAENYIQTMIKQGYSGAYFDVVDEAFTSWAKQNAPNQDPQGAMVSLIKTLADYAQKQNPNFKIWINASGAEPLLTNSTLLGAVNGVFEEQLYYQNATKPTAAADLNYNVSLLDNVTKAGKPVVAIEYVSSTTAVANVESEAAADGFGYYIADPNLNLNGVDTQGFTAAASGGGGTGTGGTGTGGTGTGGTGTGGTGTGGTGTGGTGTGGTGTGGTGTGSRKGSGKGSGSGSGSTTSGSHKHGSANVAASAATSNVTTATTTSDIAALGQVLLDQATSSAGDSVSGPPANNTGTTDFLTGSASHEHGQTGSHFLGRPSSQ